MEFYEKLQVLRKRHGWTQEELAQKLYVSRTAVSKWESGRGYPNIDSLKAIAACFSVTVDNLLSGDELLSFAEQKTKEKAENLCRLVYGLLDVSVAMFFLFPLFRQEVNGRVEAVALFALSEVQPWLRYVYSAVVVGWVLIGLMGLFWPNGWKRWGRNLSLGWNAMGAVLLMVGLQPYASLFAFAYLTMKVLLWMKRR